MRHLPLILLLIPLANSFAITITSPVVGTINGTVTFKVGSVDAGTQYVDYYIMGHSISLNPTASVAPYSQTVDTANSLPDGQPCVIAMAKDRYGNKIANSLPVCYTVNNYSNTTFTYNSPSLSSNLTGSVTFSATAQSSINGGIQRFIWYIDGSPLGSHGEAFTDLFTLTSSSVTRTWNVDTTTLANGQHWLSIGIVYGNVVASGLPTPVQYMYVHPFTIANAGVTNIELIASPNRIWFYSGKTTVVQLAPQFIRNDGTTTSAPSVTYAIDDTSVATVSGSGLVSQCTSSCNDGYTFLNISDVGTGLKTIVFVGSRRSNGGLPHHTKTGSVSYLYQPGISMQNRSMFKLDGNGLLYYDAFPLITTKLMANVAKTASINSMENRLYINPSDTSGVDTSLAIWQAGSFATVIKPGWDTSRTYGFESIGIGDDIQRTSSEINYTINAGSVCSFCASAVQYAMSQATQHGDFHAVEMMDEIGGTPIPSSFNSVISIVNASSSRPPKTWEVLSTDPAPSILAWDSLPNAEYATLYWTNLIQFQASAYWGFSLSDIKASLETAYYGSFNGYSPNEKIGSTQVDKPRYFEVQSAGRIYSKQVPGYHYHQFGDESLSEPIAIETIGPQIFWGTAFGFTGERNYAFDGIEGTGDQLFGWHRLHDAIDTSVSHNVQQQIGSSPFSSLPEVRARWLASSIGYGVLARHQKLFLSPLLDSPSYGSCFTVGTNQASDNLSRILYMTNWCDNEETRTIDLTSLRFSGAATIQRERYTQSMRAYQTMTNATSQSVTWSPGETVVWIFNNNTPLAIQ